VEAGVGNNQLSLFHYPFAEKEHVDVYLSGTPLEKNSFPHDFFNFLECMQELLRGHGGADLHHSIQEIPLGSITDRGCVVKKRGPNYAKIRM
jgi:hypothetical protein